MKNHHKPPRDPVRPRPPNFQGPEVCGKQLGKPKPDCIECGGSGLRMTHPAGTSGECICLEACWLAAGHEGGCMGYPF